MLNLYNLKGLIFLFTIALLAIFPFFLQKGIAALVGEHFNADKNFQNIAIFEETTFLGLGPTPNYENAENIRKINVIVTAYSSTPWETDEAPFITASGERVRDGIVANNMLPFGTKIRIPELYGEKIFIVKDRMHSRKGFYHVDIWQTSYDQALNFGAKYAKMEILPY